MRRRQQKHLIQESTLHHAKFNLALSLLLAVYIYSTIFKVALFQFKTRCVSVLVNKKSEWWTTGCEYGVQCVEGRRDTGAPHDG